MNISYYNPESKTGNLAPNIINYKFKKYKFTLYQTESTISFFYLIHDPTRDAVKIFSGPIINIRSLILDLRHTLLIMGHKINFIGETII